MASTVMTLGSAGRVRRHALDPTPTRVFTSDCNSFCLYCGHWFFGERLVKCTRCAGVIFKWVRNAELRLYRSRSSLSGF